MPARIGVKSCLSLETLEQRELLTVSANSVPDDEEIPGRISPESKALVAPIANHERGHHFAMSADRRIDNDLKRVTGIGGYLQHWVLDDQVYVDAREDGNRSLWSTDGTEEGTTRLLDLRGTDNLHNLTSINDKLYFSFGSQIWVTDGTEEGATRLIDAHRTTAIRNLTIFNDQLYFSIRNELWVSDGTEEGTMRLLAVGQRNRWHWFDSLTPLNDRLYFTSAGGLWVTDGSQEGTTRLFASEEENRLSIEATLDNKIFFEMDDGLWVSNGIEEATLLGINFQVFGVTKTQLFLTDTTDRALALWRTDGTVQGTYKLPSPDQVRFPTVVDDRIFFLTDGEARMGPKGNLWVSDGTMDGTLQLTDEVLQPGGLEYGCGRVDWLAADGSLYFPAKDQNGIDALWTSDGTHEGTIRLKDQFLKPLAAANGIVYLAGYDEATGHELWRSDGTPQGTLQAFDLNPGPASSLDIVSVKAISSRGMLFFAADDGTHGNALWQITLVAPHRVGAMIGDSNDDGIFDFADLAKMFQAGLYENSRDRNATFEEGDWNEDGIFDSSDLVAAFQAGSYADLPNPEDIAAAAEALFDEESTSSQRPPAWPVA